MIGWSAYGSAADAGSKNLQKARDAAQAAKQHLPASDTRPDTLLAALDAYERRGAAGVPVSVPADACPDLDALLTKAREGEEASRVRAIRSMACSRNEAVPHLIALLRDSSLAIKTASTKTLAGIGRASRNACSPLSEEIASSQQRSLKPPLDTRERDFQDVARATVQKLCKR